MKITSTPKFSQETMHWMVETIQQLSLSSNLESIMKVVRTVARELTGADGATFVLKDGNYCHYADEDAISPLWKGCKFPMSTCISGWVMINKKEAVIEDIYSDERIPADAYRPTFVKSLVMVPIRTESPIGAIGNYWASKRVPLESEVETLKILADITSVAIENVEIKSTLRKQVEERTQMVNHLEKQKEQLEEFTHIIAHNLRSPLASLVLLSDFLGKCEDLDTIKNFVNKQKTVVDSLMSTFDELINAIQIKMDFSIKHDYLDFQQSAKKVQELLQCQIEDLNAEIYCDFSEAKTVLYPSEYLESIFVNLISNSLKYAHPERTPVINIKSTKSDNWTYLTFQDNGLGIDLKKHGKDMFKLRKTFHNMPNSKGVGLFMTKNQIEAMGGEISVESNPENGTTFTIKMTKNI